MNVVARTLCCMTAALAVATCEDNEQRAHAIGAAAREAVGVTCAAKSGGVAPDPSGAEDDRSALDACTDGACRAECGSRSVPPGFERACLDTCRDTGLCATSADCGPGKDCVAIAPVVRRCVVR